MATKSATVKASASRVIDLPSPKKTGGMPLFTALSARHSTRSFSSRALSEQVLSDLAWAAFGINRHATGDRTAPYWRHVMVIDLYFAMPDGVWIYDATAHALRCCVHDDIRKNTGTQDFVVSAPLEILYVAHGERMDIPVQERRLYASVDSAFIGQNVYLFCASEGLGSVFRGSFDALSLAKLLGLGEGQFVTFVQTVGYPQP
jgi:Nitroreductase family